MINKAHNDTSLPVSDKGNKEGDQSSAVSNEWTISKL